MQTPATLTTPTLTTLHHLPTVSPIGSLVAWLSHHILTLWSLGGGGGGGSWGHGWGGSGHRGGRFGGKPWGHGGGGGGKYYGSCNSCQTPPRGYAIPPPDVYWPVDPSDYPPGPFRDHFDDIGNKCSSVNNVGNGPHAAGCCNKAGTEDGGDDNGGGGLLGKKQYLRQCALAY